jgi:L-fuconolactonase
MYRAHGPEAMRPLGEVEFVNGVAAMSASGTYGAARLCAGIIGFADLRLGEAVEPVLDAMARAAGDRFRGIRQLVTHDPEVRLHREPGHLRDPAFRKGFASLQRRSLGFEVWLYHSQLPDLIDLMEQYPEAKVALNHIGGRVGVGAYASRQDEVKATWTRDIKALARYPNIYVKLGGLGMPLCGFGFETRQQPYPSEGLAEAWRPWFETCIAAFGVQRCMFESNFPVDRVSSSYRNIWNAFKRIAGGASVNEKTALFSGAAGRFYGIEI